MYFWSLLLKLLLLTFPSSLNGGDDEPLSDWILLRSPGLVPNNSQTTFHIFAARRWKRNNNLSLAKNIGRKMSSHQRRDDSFLLSKRNGTTKWHANVTEAPRSTAKKSMAERMTCYLDVANSVNPRDSSRPEQRCIRSFRHCQASHRYRPVCRMFDVYAIYK